MNKAVIVIVIAIMIGLVAFFSRGLLANFTDKKQVDKAGDYINTKINKSKGDLISAVQDKAGQLWEDNVANFIDSTRQKTADKIQGFATTMRGNSSSYNDLKAQYDKIKADYLQKKDLLEQKVAEFESRKSKYDTEIANWSYSASTTGAASSHLSEEKIILDKEAVEIKKIQEDLGTQLESLEKIMTNKLEALEKECGI
ncbi:MAG: hypothetical protein Q7R99_01685 [bacterium]|nr:hypothetical protein [bacterium]